jgi:muconate cycloisomerase
MKIRSIDAVPFQLPARRDFRWAGLKVDLGGFVLVEVRTDEGLIGIGEATPLPDWGGDHGRRSGETPRSVIAMVQDLLAPALAGSDPLAIETARATMNRVLRGNSYAKNAVDIALHDLWGKAAGMPLHRLLGGPAREAVAVSHMVGLMPIDDAVAEASAAAADGIRALQIKGGEDAQRDIALIGRLRAELGDGVRLRLDANQGYRHPKAAIAAIRALEEAGVDFVEQPVSGHAEMAMVAAAVDVPIIADESCWDAREALEVVQERAADCISIYLAKAGGIAGARRVAAIAEAAGLPCDVNGSIESGIGNAANLHFAMATPIVELPCVIPVTAPAGRHPYKVGGNYYEDDIVTEPFRVRDGALLSLDKPGLGIDIDRDKLKRFRLD